MTGKKKVNQKRPLKPRSIGLRSVVLDLLTVKLAFKCPSSKKYLPVVLTSSIVTSTPDSN